MANFDGGHYFLTVLAPIKRGMVADANGAKRSHMQRMRQTLSTLPVARQDPPAIASPLNSPFAAVPGTHFLRFFIIDELRFNGRRPSNPIYDLLARVNMLKPEKVDDLTSPYLVLSIDFDAENGDDEQLRAYVETLWETAQEVITLVFRDCIGFEDVADAAGFFTYIKRCQVTTTMPFTDYWTIPMPKWQLPGLIAKTLAAVGIYFLAVAFSGLWPWGPVSLTVLTVLVAAIASIWMVIKVGTAVWPKAPHSDLQSVLKALYTQQMFTGFATDQQGVTDQELYDSFGKFCDTHAPSDLTGPTQAAGEIRSKWTPL